MRMQIKQSQANLSWFAGVCPHARPLQWHEVPAHTFAVPMQDVQSCDEELMGILLLVPCQVPGMSPHQVQQLVRDVGRPVPRVKLLRERRETISLVRHKCYTLNTKHTCTKILHSCLKSGLMRLSESAYLISSFLLSSFL